MIARSIKAFSIQEFKKPYRMLFPFLWKHRRAYAGLFFFMFVDVALTLAYAWFMGTITDAAVEGSFDKLGRLVPAGVLLISLSIASGYWNNMLDFRATANVKKDLKEHLLQHVLLLPAANIGNLRSGAVMTHFMDDIHGIGGMIGSSLIRLVKLPLVFIAVFVYMLQIHWFLSVLSLAVIPAALASGALFGVLLRRNNRVIQALCENLNSLLNETFLGTFVVRSFSLEKKLYRTYTAENERLFELETKDTRLRGWFRAGGEAAGAAAFLLSLCVGAYFVSNRVISIGSLLSFVNLTNHLIYPLMGIAGLWAGLQSSLTSAERLLRVLEQPLDTRELPDYECPPPGAKSIAFKDVSFGYDGSTRVIDRFSLDVPAGKTVAIVGASGAGKTTLFQLLLGFYKPETGDILVDGLSAGALTPSRLRGYMAHVPQDSFLFSGTVRDNLLLARPGVTEAAMIDAARSANIHDFIVSLPNGYDTEIGERGMKLSGGQKQRLAIARAILKDAPILLLDEATSALDGETEHQVQEALQRLMQDRTTLVIAHRLSTVRNADFIVVLDQGRIAESGTHEELLRKRGTYRELTRRQTNGIRSNYR
ncbi:ABC transporter ATP-binding protein [Paenibacillus antri]|uniref:ABC transporter ATP-binding protein n=1 Tax=Paenibacillus antri TaxID=2582848 RepID=A0A5R9G4Y0_9BACL|nr:ABC transporter ATP-binding protein [Paenibacillus antri]TLS49386.1 ABC transporter ATP-binding protein [Paenibacillus antri]